MTRTEKHMELYKTLAIQNQMYLDALAELENLDIQIADTYKFALENSKRLDKLEDDIKCLKEIVMYHEKKEDIAKAFDEQMGDPIKKLDEIFKL